MPTNPDVFYLRSRADLLQYEDARFNSLIQGVANFYSPENDQSLWGDVLRVIAQELATFEYDYAYDLVNKSPIFLTPPDIKRRWAAPLYINRLYPTLDPVQYDLDYKTMLVNLIPAYRLGSTVQSLEDIITAYTGLNIKVTELYTLIGQGFFDESDANAISVSIDVGGVAPLNNINSLNQLEAITSALYTAIDFGKPAHVILELNTVFGEGEDLDNFVSEGTDPNYGTVNADGITDSLRIFIDLFEPEPLNPILYLAPDRDPATPKTGIAPVQGWPPNKVYNPSTVFSINDSVLDPNGFVQLVTTGGTTYSAWSQFNEGIVTQTSLTGNVATYQCVNTFQNGQKVTVINTTNAGGLFNVNNATITLANGTSFQIVLVHADVLAAPEPVNAFADVQNFYTLNTLIVDANNFIQKVTASGFVGVGFPNFSETVSGVTIERNNQGTPTGLQWTNQGLFSFNTVLNGTTTSGSVVFTNQGRPPGLVAPRINLAWEIKSDTLTTFEAS